jgi:hypothetical protein
VAQSLFDEQRRAAPTVATTKPHIPTTAAKPPKPLAKGPDVAKMVAKVGGLERIEPVLQSDLDYSDEEERTKAVKRRRITKKSKPVLLCNSTSLVF